MKKFKVFIHRDNNLVTDFEIETEILIPDILDMVAEFCDNTWEGDFLPNLKVEQFGCTSQIGMSTHLQVQARSVDFEKELFEGQMFSVTAVQIEEYPES